MRGMDKIIACRTAGKKPSLVFFWMGYQSLKLDPERFEIAQAVPSLSADFRPLIGLNVVVMAANYTPAVLAVWAKIKTLIRMGTLHIEGWDDPESTFLYTQEQGERSLADWGK